MREPPPPPLSFPFDPAYLEIAQTTSARYAFAQLRRAAEDDDFLIPQELASEGHTRHCEKVLADPDGKADNILPPYESSTCVRSVYNPCIRLSEANGTWLKVPLERDFLF